MIDSYYRIAISLVDELTDRATDLMASLDAKPDTTLAIVEFIRYFDECGKQIEQLITEVDVAYQCFVLMNDYNIFVDEPEKESYMGKNTNKIKQFVLQPIFVANLQIVKI